MGKRSPAIEDTCGHGGFALLALREAGANVFEDGLPIPALRPNKWRGLGAGGLNIWLCYGYIGIRMLKNGTQS